MRMSWNGGARVKFSQHSHAPAGVILVQDQEFHSRIGSWLPFFIFGQSGVLKHETS